PVLLSNDTSKRGFCQTRKKSLLFWPFYDTLNKRKVELLTLRRDYRICQQEEFFSHRAEGGRTGRFAVAIGIRVSHVAHRKSFYAR
ncbi:MAG: hypothetical protein ACUVV0_13495, partial [Anaerolineae bacterium]